MRILSILLLVSTLVAKSAHSQSTARAVSPDGQIEVELGLQQDGFLTYRVEKNGRKIIEHSRLGIVLSDGDTLGTGVRILDINITNHDETWTQPWGEVSDIRDHHQQLKLTLEQTDGGRLMDVLVRVFNDGIGIRYEWPEQPSLHEFEITDELTEFRFASEGQAWWIRAYEWDRYEYLYESSLLSAAGYAVHTPFTVELQDGPVIAIHEASLIDYAGMSLKRKGPLAYEADLAPWSTGVRVYANTPKSSPWRVIMIGDEPTDLIENYVILNLNEPNALGDVSWVEPGKYIGIWWAMHLTEWTWGSGPNHGATTEHTRDYIDFAAEHGFDGVLVEGWNLGWDGDWLASEGKSFSFVTPYPDYDFKELADYALQRGTRLIGHHETGGNPPRYEAEMDTAFALMAARDVESVKTGYVQWGSAFPRVDGPGIAPGDTAREWNYGQYMVNHYQRTVEAAAKHQISLNIHEGVKDTGLRRTYPNLMTREAARGQEYNSTLGPGNGPDHIPTIAFTRMLSGPMDFTPGIFDLDNTGRYANKVPTTLAGQLALYVVLYSPLQMAADLPRNYELFPDAFQFIKDVPVDWSETRALEGQIGEYVTIARKDKHSGDWYLGSKTDGDARVMDVSLNFLDDGVTYTAAIYRDHEDAHWETNATAYDIETITVTSADRLSIPLAPGGGVAVRFSLSE